MCSPPGNVVGSIEQQWSILYPRYNVSGLSSVSNFSLFRFLIKDLTGQPVLKIEGPCWTCSCCNDVEFEVKSVQTDEQVRIINYPMLQYITSFVSRWE